MIKYIYIYILSTYKTFKVDTFNITIYINVNTHLEVINPVAEILSKGIKNDLNQTSLERVFIYYKYFNIV